MLKLLGAVAICNFGQLGAERVQWFLLVPHVVLIGRAKRRWVGDDLQAHGGKIVKMGSAELTRLWNINPDNLEACKAEKRQEKC